MAERIEKALKYHGGNNSPVVVKKVVITHRLIICLGAIGDCRIASFMKSSMPMRCSNAMTKIDETRALPLSYGPTVVGATGI